MSIMKDVSAQDSSHGPPLRHLAFVPILAYQASLAIAESFPHNFHSAFFQQHSHSKAATQTRSQLRMVPAVQSNHGVHLKLQSTVSFWRSMEQPQSLVTTFAVLTHTGEKICILYSVLCLYYYPSWSLCVFPSHPPGTGP